jgi:hypothetical protein
VADQLTELTGSVAHGSDTHSERTPSDAVTVALYAAYLYKLTPSALHRVDYNASLLGAGLVAEAGSSLEKRLRRLYTRRLSELEQERVSVQPKAPKSSPPPYATTTRPARARTPTPHGHVRATSGVTPGRSEPERPSDGDGRPRSDDGDVPG